MIWLGDSQRLSDGPYVQLLQAFLSRLARDPSVLTLTPEEIKGNQEGVSRHKGTGAVCQGCPSCNGPSWHFKTESVAAIWTICCKSHARNCVRPYTLNCKSAHMRSTSTGLHHYVLIRQQFGVLCCAYALLSTLWFQSLVGTPLCQLHFNSNACKYSCHLKHY